MRSSATLPRSRRLSLDFPYSWVVWKVLRIGLFYVSLIALWQLVYELEVWEPYVFPSPEGVWEQLKRGFENGTIQRALEGSMKRIAIGYFLSLCIGLCIGMAMGTSKYIDETLGSLFLGLQSLPSVTWLPLAILWFGLTEKAIIFVVLMGSLFAISISVRSGVHALPPLLRRAGQTFGANRFQMYRHVIIPGMLPSLVSGLKLGWSFAWRSLLAAELLFFLPSLGQYLQTGRELNNISQVVAGMIVIVIVGVIVDVLVFGRLQAWINDRWGLRAFS